jgi:hypothetical protein
MNNLSRLPVNHFTYSICQKSRKVVIGRWKYVTDVYISVHKPSFISEHTRSGIIEQNDLVSVVSHRCKGKVNID